MIKTGMVVNLVLGVGDSSKFNLLGGSFGQAGDVVTGGGAGAGARFFPSARDKILRAGVGKAPVTFPERGGDIIRPPRPRPND